MRQFDPYKVKVKVTDKEALLATNPGLARRWLERHGWTTSAKKGGIREMRFEDAAHVYRAIVCAKDYADYASHIGAALDAAAEAHGLSQLEVLRAWTPQWQTEDITPEFLKENDGKIVWIRDDYLSMMGYEEDPELLAFLEHVYAVKKQARDAGIEFTA